jgi:hypothetical protein
MQAHPTQRAVLGLVLDAHPKPLTISDLVRETDAQDVESAIAKLVEVGLLDRNGDAISASAAAVRFDALELP